MSADPKAQAKRLVDLTQQRDQVSRDISERRSQLEQIESSIADIKKSLLERIGSNIPTRTITTESHVVVVDKDTGVRVFDAE